MRLGLLVGIVCLPLLGLTGCMSGFQGQWVEDGVIGADGTLSSVTGTQRLALEFDEPSLVRYGCYLDQMKVVDDSSLQDDQYFLFDGWHKAQFGEMIARREGDHLVAGVSGGELRQFSRVHGNSVFPSRIRLSPLY